MIKVETPNHPSLDPLAEPFWSFFFLGGGWVRKSGRDLILSTEYKYRLFTVYNILVLYKLYNIYVSCMFHLWPLWLYSIFYSTENKCWICRFSSTTWPMVWDRFHILSINMRHGVSKAHISGCSLSTTFIYIQCGDTNDHLLWLSNSIKVLKNLRGNYSSPRPLVANLCVAQSSGIWCESKLMK